MPTNSAKRKQRGKTTFAEGVRTWSRQFSGERRVAMSEMIVAFYNETSIEDSRIGFVRNRARQCAQKRSRQGKPLSVLADMLVEESVTIFRATPTVITLDQAAKQLRREHCKFVDAVRWLCLPKHLSFSLAQPEMRYIENHALRHFRRFLAVADGRMVLLSTPTHVVDIFCIFLVNECNNRELKDMPVKLCRRCEKLFSAFDCDGKQSPKKFCTTKCQHDNFWTPKRRADYTYVQRLWNDYKSYGTTRFRNRFTKVNTQRRLLEIEDRWPDYQGITEILESIRKLAKQLRIT